TIRSDPVAFDDLATAATVADGVAVGECDRAAAILGDGGARVVGAGVGWAFKSDVGWNSKLRGGDVADGDRLNAIGHVAATIGSGPKPPDDGCATTTVADAVDEANRYGTACIGGSRDARVARICVRRTIKRQVRRQRQCGRRDVADGDGL